MYGPDGERLVARTARRERPATADYAAAAAAARRLVMLDGRLIVTVRDDAADRAGALLRSSGLRPQLQRLGSGVVRFVAPTPTAEESPVLPDVVAKLTRLGSDVVALRVP